ncbi:DUF2750 domain-containing protein [Oceaniglobus trochenteri]|uniref:DUF2750 domain-containing protein n=1 Tax=Oceaniglobus trochenteri TaxID=2763260 RepID=UPI001CFFAD71|nr:DUF2750 domain-containing protein [Oceaniglobus trochenteri]
MDQEKISALLSLDPEDRYWATVDRVAETGAFWTLHGESGWLTPLAPEGFEYLPVWSDRALAQLIADLLFPGNTPTEITLEEFRAHWIDDLDEGGVRIGVFPDNDGTFWEVGAVTFYDALDDMVQTRI